MNNKTLISAILAALLAVAIALLVRWLVGRFGGEMPEARPGVVITHNMPSLNGM